MPRWINRTSLDKEIAWGDWRFRYHDFLWSYSFDVYNRRASTHVGFTWNAGRWCRSFQLGIVVRGRGLRNLTIRFRKPRRVEWSWA